jgi:hypothetical protein
LWSYHAGVLNEALLLRLFFPIQGEANATSTDTALAIVATIFLPLTFLVGVFGMNFHDVNGTGKPGNYQQPALPAWLPASSFRFPFFFSCASLSLYLSLSLFIVLSASIALLRITCSPTRRVMSMSCARPFCRHLQAWASAC